VVFPEVSDLLFNAALVYVFLTDLDFLPVRKLETCGCLAAVDASSVEAVVALCSTSILIFYLNSYFLYFGMVLNANC
jgi:hypothetical protein